ncbi:ATP-binding cassette sub-family C member 4-like [Sitodiplosis mosellana]|uniref:ATP-binding cassette sub-family C member 4-like n=1 Tax=Sitodiplosis mosellana TaxID=263140 RepID=UPI002445019C|nr:ATP-binding cassette sub-family C member 4-like [Sitodiplosis mosellana]
MGRMSAQLRKKSTKRTDFRVKIMNEILLGIQVIKMYAWEKSFAEMVDKIRKKEVDAIRSSAYIRATINSFTMISKVSIFLSLVSYVYFGNVITARKVFIVSSYFNILNVSMVAFWPIVLTYTAEAYVSVRRIQEFLLRPESKHAEKVLKKLKNHKNGHLTNGELKSKSNDLEMLDKNRHRTDPGTIAEEETLIAADTNKLNESPCRRVQNIDDPDKFIRLVNATAVWEQSEGPQKNGIFDMNLEIKPGLCAVVGQVGSSKSTLLNLILGELSLDSGSMTINGTISYASQEPWIFEGSVRNNIVFVEEFDEQRYNKVVEVCALERDFKLLPQGDATIVGEQGSSLSGGQKARVNLARAIYKQSDIYLLDDPLSAIDTHVGKHIFDKCIKGFLSDKICVLVTHQLQYLRNVQHVVLLNKGKVEAQGPFQTLQRFRKKSLVNAPPPEREGGEKVVEAFPTRIRKNLSTLSFFSEDALNAIPDKRKERQSTGNIKFSTYKTYFKAAHSRFIVTTIFTLFIVAQCILSGADYFLAKWVDWEEKVTKAPLETPNNSTDEPLAERRSSILSETVEEKRELLLIIYTAIILLSTICVLCRSFSSFRMCLRISINLHDIIFRGITRAKMSFFNNNPSGRILNRFAKDISNVDSSLPSIMIDVSDCFLQYVAIIVINVIVNPWMLIPAVVMTMLFYSIRLAYLNTGRSFMRIEALSRSPIFSHVNATIQGSSTVRAFNAEKFLENEFHEFQDFNTSCWYLFIGASRWFAFWLDLVCLLYVIVVTYSFLLFSSAEDSGKVGLAIMSSINLIGLCQWGMRVSAELENQMTSVERVVEYAELPSEPPLESNEKNAPPKDWPYYGNIEFKSLSMRYAEKGARTLRNLNFRINAKEKVGVVGRTGAGKSSIIQSLFRLAQNEGQILIDGVDVGVIGLHDLRKKISIIPQEAVLFSGSLRFNLDPFAERSDDELWNSLEQVELKSEISSMPGGLDCKVLDGGSNFSAGQRQLLCLARAILRNNKILILDEATANVDSETDKLIQNTIRNKFGDCTVITIAHRLHTVMDSDKILVMDAGEVVEFDHPFELIQDSGGFFKRLLDQTDSSMVTALTLVAKESYDRCNAKE